MLHKKQEYVFEIANDLNIELKLIHHKRPTRSCEEKLELLKEENTEFSNWNLDRIVKALYFHKNGQHCIGIITPEFGISVKSKDIISKVLEISRTQAEKYWVDPNHVPKGMSWGTCTPFPLVSSVGSDISNLIILDHPPINNKLVDISVGGVNKKMFTVSMHLPYKAIYQILNQQFGDRIHLYQG